MKIKLFTSSNSLNALDRISVDERESKLLLKKLLAAHVYGQRLYQGIRKRFCMEVQLFILSHSLRELDRMSVNKRDSKLLLNQLLAAHVTGKKLYQGRSAEITEI